MCLLGGRSLFEWFRISSKKKESIKETPQPSVKSAPSQENSVKDRREEGGFDCADKSDCHLLELTQNGLKSLHQKLELVILGKTVNDAFHYWEFPLSLSQSRLNGRNTISNACTLITITIASTFYSNANLSTALRLDIPREGFTEGEILAMNLYKVCPPEVIRVMKDAIEKGNTIYDEERKRGKDSVMYVKKGDEMKDIITIPDAIIARNRYVMGGSGEAKSKDTSVMNEIDFVPVRGSVGQLLYKHVKIALNHPSLSEWTILCFIIICHEKAVSLVYRRDTDLFCLLDSHAHDNSKNGSIVSVSNRANFRQMAQWMDQRIFPDPKNIKHKKFELCLLQWTNRKAVLPLNPNVVIDNKIFLRSSSPRIKSPLNSLASLCLLQPEDSGYESDDSHISN